LFGKSIACERFDAYFGFNFGVHLKNHGITQILVIDIFNFALDNRFEFEAVDGFAVKSLDGAIDNPAINNIRKRFSTMGAGALPLRNPGTSAWRRTFFFSSAIIGSISSGSMVTSISR
jgi:hypothetical protein